MSPTLSDFATLVDAPPKWVLNTMDALGCRPRYSLALARQLAVTRALHVELHLPLVPAHRLAARALSTAAASDGTVSLAVTQGGSTRVSVDVARLNAAFAMRQALLRTMHAPLQRGRPPMRRKDSIAHATEWGIDISLLRANLALTPAQRLRQLDSMAAFARDVRRSSSSSA